MRGKSVLAVAGIALAFGGAAGYLLPRHGRGPAAATRASRTEVSQEGVRRALASAVGLWIVRGQPRRSALRPERVVTKPIEGVKGDPEVAFYEEHWPDERGDRGAFYPKYATGLIFGKPNVVLTSARPLLEAQQILVFPPEGRVTTATVAVVDRQTGLALLRCARAVGEAEHRPAQAVRTGDGLLMVGCPQALSPCLTRAVVSAAGRGVFPAPGVPALQVYGISTAGFEGGPAFTPSGELVGITFNWPVGVAPGQTMWLETGGGVSVDAAGGVAFVVPTNHPAVWERLTTLARQVP